MYAIIVIFAILFLMVIFLIGGTIYSATKGKLFARLYHDAFHWHVAKYDFGDNKSICAVCGKVIFRTEDGPWISTR